MKRVLASTGVAVALALSMVLTATAAPGGGGGGGGAAGGGQPSFRLSSSSLSFSKVASIFGAQAQLTVTTKKSIALVGPSVSGSPYFTDFGTGSCWTQYLSLGQKIPAKTSCTIDVFFFTTVAGTYTSELTVAECKSWHLDGSGGIACDQPGASKIVPLTGIATSDLPDIYVQDVTFITSQHYTVTTRNIYGSAADVSNYTIQGYFSADGVVDQDDGPACGWTLTGTLEIGQTQTSDVDCGFGPRPGDQWLLLDLDIGNSLLEYDESNLVIIPLPA